MSGSLLSYVTHHAVGLAFGLLALSLRCRSTELIIEWAERHAIDHSKVKVSFFDKGGFEVRGLEAATDIRRGETVLSVPWHFVIDNSTTPFDNCPGLLEDVQQAFGDWAETYYPYLTVLMHKEMGKESPFYEAILSWPTFEDFRAYYPYAAGEEVWEDFRHVPLVYDHAEWRDYLRRLQEVVVKFSTTHPQQGCFKTTPTLEDLLWAECIASTRQYDNGLAPLLDFANSPVDPMEKANTDWIFEHQKRAYVAAARDIRAGEEITEAYAATRDHAYVLDTWGILKPEKFGPPIKQLDRKACKPLHVSIRKYLGKDGACLLPSIVGCNLARLSKMMCRETFEQARQKARKRKESEL